MSDNPTFWQRNGGAALLGVAAYLIVTPAFGFGIEQEVTEGHEATPAEGDRPEEQTPIIGGILADIGAPRPDTRPVADAITAANSIIASQGIRIVIPDPTGAANDAIDLVGSSLPTPPDSIDLFGTQIDVSSPGSIALVGQIIDLTSGVTDQPSEPADLVAAPAASLVAIVGSFLTDGPAPGAPEADSGSGDFDLAGLPDSVIV